MLIIFKPFVILFLILSYSSYIGAADLLKDVRVLETGSYKNMTSIQLGRMDETKAKKFKGREFFLFLKSGEVKKAKVINVQKHCYVLNAGHEDMEENVCVFHAMFEKEYQKPVFAFTTDKKGEIVMKWAYQPKWRKDGTFDKAQIRNDIAAMGGEKINTILEGDMTLNDLLKEISYHGSLPKKLSEILTMSFEGGGAPNLITENGVWQIIETPSVYLLLKKKKVFLIEPRQYFGNFLSFEGIVNVNGNEVYIINRNDSSGLGSRRMYYYKVNGTFNSLVPEFELDIPAEGGC